MLGFEEHYLLSDKIVYAFGQAANEPYLVLVAQGSELRSMKLLCKIIESNTLFVVHSPSHFIIFINTHTHSHTHMI